MTTQDDRRMATWLRPVVVRLVLFAVLFAGVLIGANAAAGGTGPVPVIGLLTGLVCAWLAVEIYRRTVRAAERREVTELAWPDAKTGLRKGVLLGLGMFTVTILVIAVFGGYGSDGFDSVNGAINLIGLMATVAVVEELLFRGVVFRLVEQLTGTRAALVISAVLFGCAHLVNPGATVLGAISIAVEGGLMLAAAYAVTRSLWLPIGLHFAWNYAEQGIFGATASGSSQDLRGLFHSVLTGPSALTGGDFGPEASLIAIIVCGIPAFFFLRAAARKGNLHRGVR